MSQLKKGAILNYGTIFLTNIVGIILTPFIIKSLGDAEYGLYILIGAFVGYISLFDFGLNNAVVRFVAKYRAERDTRGEENFLATTLIIYSIISFLVIGIGGILYVNIQYIFGESLTNQEIVKAEIMFVILVFNLAIRLPGGIFEGICSGYEQFVFPKSVNIIRYIVRSLTVVIILIYGGKAISIVVIDTVMNLLIIIVNAFFVFRKLKVKIKLHQFEIFLVKNIFSYSIWIFVGVLVGQFQWQGGQLVLGILSDTKVVAIFAVGIVLGTYYATFSSAMTGVFLPRATQMIVANASGEELTSLMIKIGRISFLVLVYILIAFFLYGKQFIYLWVGEIYNDSWLIAFIIMLGYTVPLIQAFGHSILQAKNKLAFKSLLYLFFIVVGTILGAFLVKRLGAVGMVFGSTLGWIIAQLIMNIYYRKVIRLNVVRFFKEVLSRIFVVSLIVLFIGGGIDKIPGEGWLSFVIKTSFYSVSYVVLMYSFAILPDEKKLFNSLWKGIFYKNKIERIC